MISEAELREVCKKLKNKKACGVDDIAPEFWKYLAEDTEALYILYHFLNTYFAQAKIPKSWKHSRVTTIFKKGDCSLPENFRPISLLCVGYKCLASVLLQRIKLVGSEKRIRKSQFGFRAHHSTGKARAILCRILDIAHSDSDTQLHVKFCD